MPLPQPPAQQRQNTAAPSKTTMATTGLARTRSLRRPQATGLPGASLTAPSTASAPSASSASSTRMLPKKLPSSSTAPGNGTSNTRLPLKPTRAVASAATATASSAAARPRLSPVTGGPSARLRRPEPASSASQATSTSTAAPRTAKPPSSSRTHLLGPSAPPPAPATGTTRRSSSSSGRPSSSGGLPVSPGGARAAGPAARGHARTKSTSSVTPSVASQRAPPPGSSASPTLPASPTRRMQSIQPVRPTRHPITSAPVLRPPSSQSVQSSSGGSSAGARANVRAPAATTTAAVTASSRTQKEALTGRPRTRDGGAPGKPSFSTLQQHYSPAKNTAPKPRVAAILAPPASPSKKPANVALSAETTRLQTHLLQLHILHRDAADVSAEWHASARQVLIDARFTALAADHTELVQITAKRAESANAAALQDWASFREDNGMTLEEKIQTLDEVLAGVWSLAGDSHYSHPPHPSSAVSTSRFAQVVRRFERWAQQTAAQVEARQGIESLGDLDDLSDDEDSGTQGIGGLLLSNETEPLLDAAWHEECGQLTRRLQGWQRQLDVLGRGVLDTSGAAGTAKADKEAQPSLPRMLAGCAGLVEGMLEELQAMQQLAREAAEQELAWVRRMNAAAGVSSDGQNEEGIDARKARAGAIWRTV